MSNKYAMSISLNVLNHLGLHLYSNTPAVLAEVIANAWDADANTVTVDFDLNDKTITITDDGHGMDLDDINQKYLYVGFQKRDGGHIRTLSGRQPMGRKGIGKLSLFSIANKFEVFSRKDGCPEQSFLMDATLSRHTRSSLKRVKEWAGCDNSLLTFGRMRLTRDLPPWLINPLPN